MQRFMPSVDTGEDSINISINLVGNGGIDTLIAAIESMKRVTQINTVSIYFGEQNSVDMYVTVYTIR